MPWDVPQKKVIRVNPDFTGETVWQQDQQATIKIIASRHDVHDQDLADAISRCLNIDGVNELAANLDMNNYVLVNVADGVNPNDGVNKAQMEQEVFEKAIEQLDWDGSINTLKALTGDASEIPVVIENFNQIKSGGLIKHASATFAITGGVVALQTLSSSRWTATNNGGGTLNFELPTGDDPYLGADYCVEGTVLMTNSVSPGQVLIHVNGALADANSVLGDHSGVGNAKSLLSYIIHRSAGNAYDYLFVWSAVTT